MQRAAASVIEVLERAFPQRVALEEITRHDCDECAAIRRGLAGRTWGEVPNAFAEEFYDSLPLLSPDAYNAYLAVWLRASVENPDGDAAGMIAINLSHKPNQAAFTLSQASALIAAVEFVASNNLWGAEDPGNVEQVAAVRATWASVIA